MASLRHNRLTSFLMASTISRSPVGSTPNDSNVMIASLKIRKITGILKSECQRFSLSIRIAQNPNCGPRVAYKSPNFTSSTHLDISSLKTSLLYRDKYTYK